MSDQIRMMISSDTWNLRYHSDAALELDAGGEHGRMPLTTMSICFPLSNFRGQVMGQGHQLALTTPCSTDPC